ncbi:hypothetical protein EHE21_08870 [Proteus sp. GOKU]|uniref:AAA family ATPase n=1 Tax=Proteus TaxID=583 RepID=UPI001892C0D1|nr:MULTISPECIES: AAA family ATPase [Proteus]QPB79485.1 hypothetical protein EHE21_08870 [Proteus sp. GOKU]QQP25492.1 hypothetical protein D7029_08870 [Proteus vulgaris]
MDAVELIFCESINCFDYTSFNLKKTNYILISPSGDKFNDFGKVTSVLIYAQFEDAKVEFHTKLAILDVKENNQELTLIEYLKKTNNNHALIYPNDDILYFSQCQSLDTYRYLHRTIGKEKSDIILTKINDLSTIRNKKKYKKKFQLFIKSKIFQTSLIRTSESYYAFKNSTFISGEIESQEIKNNELEFSVDIDDGESNRINLDFNFSYKKKHPRNIITIIGSNGNGKSRTLSNIAKMALSGSKSYGNRIEVNRILLFAPRHELRSFPSERWKNPATDYRTFPTTRSYQTRSKKTTTETILDIIRSEETIAGRSRWKIFSESLSELTNHDEIYLKGSSSKKYFSLKFLNVEKENDRLLDWGTIQEDLEPIRLIQGNEFKLSSGEISFLKIITNMTMHIENGSLLLIDEPETHLHPNFISLIISALHKILTVTGSYSIISTHSVYIVREVPQDQVIILERNEKNNVVQKITGMATLGANLGSLSSFIFGENSRSKLVNEIAQKVISEHESFEEIEDLYRDSFSIEMLSLIRGMMK